MGIVVAILAAVLALGSALLAVGLRGRPTDDHPLCRRCRYDLTGSPAGGPCPECGADTGRRRAVRVGHRVRRPAVLTAGVLLLLLFLTAAGLAGWARARGIDPTPYKPAWWLRHDLDAGPALQAKALAELTARVGAGRLATSAAAAVADRALHAQAAETPWNPAWGTYVEAAHAAGQLDRARWARYGRQAVKLTMVATGEQNGSFYSLPFNRRNVFVKGDHVFFLLHGDQRPLAAAQFEVLIDLVRLEIDGLPVEPYQGSHGPEPTLYSGRTWCLSMAGALPCMVKGCIPDLSKQNSDRLALGSHTVRAVLRAYLYDTKEFPSRKELLTKRDGHYVMLMPDTSKLLSTFEVVAPHEFRVVLTLDPAKESDQDWPGP